MRSLLLKTGRRTFHSISSDDILYIERLKGRVRIFLKNKNIRVNSTFLNVSKQLDKRFVQCHRRFIVNTSYVIEFTTKRVNCTDGSSIPIGQTYKDEFIEYMINNHDSIGE